MLEIKNLTKIYEPKKGLPVLALDGVNMSFPETGMIFVLGKSGSGKSTFLNLISGLDSVTEGEVIVKGKSSKEFSQSDFDSYRNTFLGFIFQEFNILNEFSIGKNIALALELQGKKADEKTVEDILEQVDLKGYYNRRPNELSGGQKQRVAIARALIKNPEIIMADEPTGSLDSNTGKQIFETLQKLSKTKLVIIVSHDREYAEFYGDRVIEFADGKVISDIQKKKVDTEQNESSKAKEFRRFADIDREELFEPVTTKNQNIKKYDPKDLKLIRSSMPIKHAFKMAASSLKSKPIRLIFTIILLITAFTMFGLADSVAAYNKYNALNQLMQERSIDYAAFGKYVGGNRILLTENDFDTIKKKFPASKFDALRTPNADEYYSTFTYSNNIYQYQKDAEKMGIYYSQRHYREWLGDGYAGDNRLTLSGIIEIDPSGISGQTYHGFNITGSFPASDNEIMISYYVYEAYEKYGYIDAAAMLLDGAEIEDIDNYKSEISCPDDWFGKELLLDISEDDTFKTAKVVGIVDTDFPKIFDNLKEYKPPVKISEMDKGPLPDWESITQIVKFMNNSYHGALFIKEGAYQAFKVSGEEDKYLRLSEAPIWYDNDGRATVKLNVTLKSEPNEDWFRHWDSGSNDAIHIARTSEIGSNGLIAAFADPSKTTLEDNEALLSVQLAASLFDQISGYKKATNWIESFGKNMEKDERVLALPRAFINEFFGGETSLPAFSSLYCAPIDDFSGHHSMPNIEIVGIALDTEYLIYKEKEEGHHYSGFETNFNKHGAVISDALYSQISGFSKLFEGHNIRVVLTKLPSSNRATMEMIRYSYANIFPHEHPLGGKANGSYMIFNGVSETLEEINDNFKYVAIIFMWTGVGCAAFAALLFMNFIFVSISYKYKEIGILRALGARPADVFKIFVLESLIIAVFCCILSAVVTGISAYFINLGMRTTYNFVVSILNFGIRQVALIFLVGVATTFISTFLPVYKASKKKPIETIRTA